MLWVARDSDGNVSLFDKQPEKRQCLISKKDGRLRYGFRWVAWHGRKLMNLGPKKHWNALRKGECMVAVLSTRS